MSNFLCQERIVRGCSHKCSFDLYQAPSETPKKGCIGQNWVNDLYNVKFDFQHDRSNFRAHWGHRTKIFSIFGVFLTILTIFRETFSDWFPGQARPFFLPEIWMGNSLKCQIVKMATKMLQSRFCAPSGL